MPNLKLKIAICNLWRKRTVRILLTTIIIIAAGGYLLIGRPAVRLLRDGQTAIKSARELKAAIKEQNLSKIEGKTTQIQDSIAKLRQDIRAFSFIQHLPRLNTYYYDANHLLNAGGYAAEAVQISLKGLEPYASVLGLKEDAQPISTQEKVAQLAAISPSLIPHLDQAQEKMTLTLNELAQIHPEIYPQSLGGFQIKDNLNALQTAIPQIQSGLSDIKPFLLEIPSLLGVDIPKTYLVLFQNDKELRPTGGFITAYALAKLDRGYFSIIFSDDIYNLDPKQSYLPAPAPIIRHLKQKGWWMRDTNFSPDFKQSMQDFKYYYQHTASPPVAGIFALDTQFVESFLELSGPITVPGYNVDPVGYWNLPQSCLTGGNAFTSENVVCRLELYAEKVFKSSKDRKAILGDLMAELVEWALNAPSNKWPELLSLATSQLQEKHLLVYFHNKVIQDLAEKYNWAGRIAGETGSDYLHINQANLAGLKSDMYMKRKVKQEISVNSETGEVITKLTLTYRNTGAYDGWLNSTARNYIRVYVPKGSQLISASGGEYPQPNVFEDLNKTVFDNFILTRPLSETTLTFEYKLPFYFKPGKNSETNEYRLLIQKQPGLNAPEYEILLGGEIQKFKLTTDEEITFNLKRPH